MSILSQLNSVPMYLICGGIIAFGGGLCDFSGEGHTVPGRHSVYGYHENEAYDHLQCDLFPVAQCVGSCWVSSLCREVWNTPGRGFDCP